VRRTRLAAFAGLLGALLGAAGAVPAAATPLPASHVVVVGVAGLRWTDVSPQRTPTLARLADGGSVGSMSVRTAPSVTCSGEGWLTLGTGTYAAVEDPARTKASRGCGPRQPPPVDERHGAGQVVTMPLLERVNDGLRFGAHPGLLGDTVPCASAVGPGAALAVADPTGHVEAYTATLPDNPRGFLARCPLTAVDLGALPASGNARNRALADFDAALGRIEETRPRESVLIVAGLAETDAHQPRLHVAVVAGENFTRGWLRSPSTRRKPYVQLSDLAPTAMAQLGYDVPEAMAGRPLMGRLSGRPESLGETIRHLADTDKAAVAQRDVLGEFFVGLGVASLLVYGGLIWLLWRRRRGVPVPARALRGLGVAALGLASVPGCTFVVNAVPWWRSPWPAATLSGLVLAAAAATVAIAYAGPWRRWAAGLVAAVCAVTVVVTIIDGLTGATLQINSMLGYNPLVAGRFVGFGNIAFAAFGAAVMLLTALLAHGRSRPVALAVVAAIALPMIVVDGSPAWGADFGGVLTFVPAFVVLALLVARARINVARLLLAGAAGVALVAVIGIVDFQRPVEARSHFGRFVASVLDGSAGATVYRKLLTSLDLLLIGPHTILAMALVVWLAVLVFRPPPTLSEAYGRIGSLRVALIAVVVLSAIGFGTNDSSVAIPVVAGMVALPAALALCATALAGVPVPRRALPAATSGDDAATRGSTPPDTPVAEVARPTEVLP